MQTKPKCKSPPSGIVHLPPVGSESVHAHRFRRILAAARRGRGAINGKPTASVTGHDDYRRSYRQTSTSRRAPRKSVGDCALQWRHRRTTSAWSDGENETRGKVNCQQPLVRGKNGQTTEEPGNHIQPPTPVCKRKQLLVSPFS